MDNALLSFQDDDTEPTSADLDLSTDPDLEAIADPAEIEGTATHLDLTDPDIAGEADPDQSIDPLDDVDGANGDVG